MDTQFNPPKRFGDLLGDETAAALHRFINTPDSVRKLKDASERRRPAVEGILLDLVSDDALRAALADGSDQTRDYRYRQFIGKVVKDALASQGWEVGDARFDRQVRVSPSVQEQVRSRLGRPFIGTGARYREKADPQSRVP
jgi:hypothetical protein